MKTLRIGTGAGFSGDRIEPALELAEKGDIRYLVFECLAERTIAIAQQARLADPTKGYDPLFAARMRSVLGVCRKNRITIVTNMGAANPLAGARIVLDIARTLGLHGLKIAAITGDDVTTTLENTRYPIEETGMPVSSMASRIVSANVYLGAAPIVEALEQGAHVVVAGRVADPALFLAPQIYEFGWSMTDWNRLGKGTLVGHLLECAGQVTGGYFADPGYKDVGDLARLGFPLAEITGDGDAVITKVPGSGGAVTEATCKEQLLYEIHDPAAYVTPDVIADFSRVAFRAIGPDRVLVEGAGGRPRPETLKVSLGCRDGFIGEGQISYAGAGAVARGRLARDIVRARLELTGVETTDLRFDLIGVDAIHGASLSAKGDSSPHEVRLRVAGRTDSMAEAVRIGNEVETLYTNGPAGGGGVTKSAKPTIAMFSLLMPRHLVTPAIQYWEA